MQKIFKKNSFRISHLNCSRNKLFHWGYVSFLFKFLRNILLIKLVFFLIYQISKIIYQYKMLLYIVTKNTYSIVILTGNFKECSNHHLNYIGKSRKGFPIIRKISVKSNVISSDEMIGFKISLFSLNTNLWNLDL